MAKTYVIYIAVISALVSLFIVNEGFVSILEKEFGFQSVLGSGATIDAKDLTLDMRSGLRLNKGSPFTGTAITRSKEGGKLKEERFKQGLRNGTTVLYFPHEKIAFEAHYIMGKRNGTEKSWWSNGNLRSETYYKNDDPDGVAWKWYRSGEKFKKEIFKNGQPAGLQQGWRKNGKLFSNFVYKNGRTYGLKNSNLCVELNNEKVAFNPRNSNR